MSADERQERLAVAAEHAMLERMFALSPSFMALMRGPEHRYEVANAAYLKLIGRTEVIGKTAAETLSTAVSQGFLDLLDQVYASGEPFTAKGALCAVQAEPDGPVVNHWVDFVLQPLVGSDGRVEGLFVEGYDVTDRVTADTQLKVLNAELAHRLKNTLAMVQALVAQTLRGLPDRAPAQALEQRLTALGNAHDVLLLQQWSAAPLKSVVEAAVKGTGFAERFSVTGPEVTLGPRATLSLSMVIHELATNAIKYGALSVDGGSVAIAWSITDADGGTLVLRWMEQGGPPAVEPTSTGFGSRLVAMGLVGTGGVQLTYDSSGFAAEMTAPLEQVQQS